MSRKYVDLIMFYRHIPISVVIKHFQIAKHLERMLIATVTVQY